MISAMSSRGSTMLARKVSAFVLFALASSMACVAQATSSGDTPCFDPSLRVGNSVSLSAAKECYGQVALDSEVTIQGITSLLDTMEHFYAFYNYAVDAPNSSPLNNPENWFIFNGTSGGQANLSQKRQELINQVERDGATLLTVMDLASTVAAPRDTHISPITLYMNNAVLGSAGFAILDDSERTGSPSPGRYLTLDEINGVVSVVMKSNDTEEVTKVIETIDGVRALDYLEGFVSLPGMAPAMSYKALGSRMQSFLQGASIASPTVARISRALPNVFDDLPDSVEVKFQDGSSTTWLYNVLPGFDGEGNRFINYTVDELTAYANTEPKNSPFTAFSEALRQAAEVRSIPDYPKVPSNSSSRASKSDIGRITQTPSTPLNWTFFYEVGEKPEKVLFAVTTVGDATVLKFQGFDLNANPVQDSLTLCKYIYDYGEKNGNTKLLVDLTDNGGGNVDQTFAMTQCLYPQASYTQLFLPYELRWPAYRNQQVALERYSGKVASDIVGDADDVKAISKILSADIPSSLLMLRRMRNILKGMQQLQLPYPANILSLSLMIDEVKRSKHFRTSFVETLLQMPDFSNSLAGVPPDVGFQLNGEQQLGEAIQGGIPTAIWTNWTRLQPTNFVEMERGLTGLKNPYQSYGIIGNGLGGSSSSTFEMNVIETSQLNPTWTPAKTFSYGCVGNKESCPVNQYQGGTVGTGASLNKLSYDSVGWFLFLGEFFGQIAGSGGNRLPTSITDQVQAYISEVENFMSEVPAPPELATAGVISWQFTAYSVLSKMTGFDSIPAEYFATPPTEYIPFWPDWSKAGAFGSGDAAYSSGTLQPLYETVASKI